MPGSSSDQPRTSDLVLVDTNVWASFERGADQSVTNEVRRLWKVNAAAFIPPVLFEFGRGLVRRADAFEYRYSRYRADFPLVPLEPDDWHAALRLARAVAASPGKHRVQQTDLLLAAVAVRIGAPVWSHDPDFARVAGHEPRLRRHIF